MANDKIQRALERFKSINPIEYRHLEDGAALEYDVPGLTFGDLDRSGNWAIWAIMKYTEMPRHINYYSSLLESSPTSDSFKYVLVLRSQTITISNSLYNRPNAFTQPLTIINKPWCSGNKSVTMLITITDKATGEVLLVNERQIIRIDKASRKATLIPEDVKLKFQGRSSFYLEQEHPPEDSVCLNRQVNYSDYDYLHHVNAFSYLRWCVDAATEASLKGKLLYFTRDVAEYKIKRVETLYLSEAFVGDKVSIRLWPKDYKTLLFTVSSDNRKSNKQVAFVRMTFYKEDEKTARSKL